MKTKTSLLFIMLVFSPTVLLLARNTASHQNNQQLKFEVIKKTKAAGPVKICDSGSIREGKMTWNFIDANPAKGDMFWLVRIRITNFNTDAIKFSSESDLVVKTADGESIPFYSLSSFDGTSAYAGYSWTYEFLPDEPLEKDFLLALPLNKANQIILQYLNENALIIDF